MFARNFLRNMTGRMSRVASATQKRHGGGGSHHGPNKWAAANKEFGIELHEPAMMHKASANFLLLVCWVWVMYRIKEDKGKMMVSVFGLLMQWLITNVC